MGKKRRRAHKVSKGIHTSIKEKVATPQIDRILNKLKAWKQGKNPWVTIANPQGAADRKFVRVRANSLWGNHKSRYNIFMKKEKNAPSLLQR